MWFGPLRRNVPPVLQNKGYLGQLAEMCPSVDERNIVWAARSERSPIAAREMLHLPHDRNVPLNYKANIISTTWQERSRITREMSFFHMAWAFPWCCKINWICATWQMVHTGYKTPGIFCTCQTYSRDVVVYYKRSHSVFAVLKSVAMHSTFLQQRCNKSCCIGNIRLVSFISRWVYAWRRQAAVENFPYIIQIWEVQANSDHGGHIHGWYPFFYDHWKKCRGELRTDILGWLFPRK